MGKNYNNNICTYEKIYSNIYNWFMAKHYRLNILQIIYKYLPILTALAYFIIILYHIFYKSNYIAAARVILVPFAAFVTVTFLRKFINAPRPYTKYNITPLIPKKKQYESFPSRHTLSITIIAMTGSYTDVRLGIVLWCMAVILATSRVLAGVHFVKDVCGAAVISIVFGYIGLWVL